jgi:hypothetical protein
MKISTPFAGPVSFPLLVAKERGLLDGYQLSNSCMDRELGEVVLDSITNVWRAGKEYRVASGVFVRMYSLLGNKGSDKVFTVRKGTLADYNARVYALYHGKCVVNTTPEDVLEKANQGFLGIVGNEVFVGPSLEDEFAKDGILSPSCMIVWKVEDGNVLRIYDEGVKIIDEDPAFASSVISRESKYYSEGVMKRIISLYKHKRTERLVDLRKAIDIYSKVEPEVTKVRL